MEEKRKHIRKNFDKQIALKKINGEQFTVLIENFSEKGVCVTLRDNKSFDVGESLKFEMVISQEKDIVVNGRAKIMWKNSENQYGLLFEMLDENSAENLNKILSADEK
ncbi:MAG: PilZ domain-containing protein [Candidatus Omnitrophica bacterium]|nr:PilZ domain-containing protein [Candidatus Omnitrophota bacterium]